MIPVSFQSIPRLIFDRLVCQLCPNATLYEYQQCVSKSNPLLARQTSILDVLGSWRCCNHAHAIRFLVHCPCRTCSRAGCKCWASRAGLHCRSGFTSCSCLGHSCIPVHVIQRLWPTPLNSQRHSFYDSFALAGCCRSFSTFAGQVVHESAVRAVRANNGAQSAELGKVRTYVVLREIVLDACYE